MLQNRRLSRNDKLLKYTPMTENNQQTQTSGKLWGGRFAEQTAASVEAFTESISYDWRLYRHDQNFLPDFQHRGYKPASMRNINEISVRYRI